MACPQVGVLGLYATCLGVHQSSNLKIPILSTVFTRDLTENVEAK